MWECVWFFDARHLFFSVSDWETKVQLNQLLRRCFSFNFDSFAENTHQNAETIWLLRYEHKPTFNVSLYAEVVEMHVHSSPRGT